MTDPERLESWFAEGLLSRPGAVRPDLVDFSRALASLAGAPGLKLPPPAAELKKTIGPAEHYVLVLLDGFGVDQLKRCPTGGFFQKNVRAELRSVFPSTTAAALTSLYTGEHPARHGILAWWLRLAGHDLTATVLPFVERFSEQPLTELGVKPEEILTVPSMTGRMAHDPLAVLPAGLTGSVYSVHSSGGTAQAGYSDLPEAFELAAGHAQGTKPTFTYVYLPQADGLAHEQGTTSPAVLETLAAVDGLVAKLAARLAGRARILVTGDHGQVDVPEKRTLFLDEASPLMSHLCFPPSGERTVPFFHVQPGRREEFAVLFRAEYGEFFALLSLEEVEATELFGSRPLSPTVRERLGDFLAIAPRPTTLNYRQPGVETGIHLGVHAGLSPAEMIMPLVMV